MNDYVFFPIAFALRRQKKTGVFLAVLLTFLISGFWHGADWKFILWGAIHGVAFAPSVLRAKRITNLFSREDSSPFHFHNVREFSFILGPLIVNLFAWVFFRAESIQSALIYLETLSKSGPLEFKSALLFFPVLILTDRFQIHLQRERSITSLRVQLFEASMLSLMILLTLIVGISYSTQDFIYFQF